MRQAIRTRNHKLETVLLENLKLQKRLADNNLIAVLKHMALSRQQPSTAIDECTVGRAEVFNKVLAVVTNDPRVAPRDPGFRVVFVQIAIGEYPAVRVPPADVRLDSDQRKLFADSPA